MPELPEVETMCRGIRSVVGRTIQSVSQPPCLFRPIRIQPRVTQIDRRLRSRTVTAVTRLGKRVLVHVGQDVLILQPKMSGLVALDEPPDADHIRLRINFTGSPKLRLQFWDRRGLGTVELMPENEIEERVVHGKLGPDALDIPADDFAMRLAATSRPIKVALLDQKLLAGVGNLYASEMLHVARIHPAIACSQISRRRILRLYEAMQEILRRAIEFEGSTLADGTYRNTINDPGKYQNQHRVYDCAGLRCPTCERAVIKRIVQAQRSTFYCPRCQRG